MTRLIETAVIEVIGFVILLPYLMPMTVVERVNMVVCSFCLDFHEQYMKGVPFKYARKEAVTDCWLCKQVMCADCQENSQKEVAGDPLSRYWLTICQQCVKTWRTTTNHLEYKAAADKEEEKFRESIRKVIYMVTQAKQCH